MTQRVQGRLSLIILMSCLLVGIRSFGQANVVPDDVEFAVLKSLYDNLGGSGWTKKTNWPAAGAWPASATSAQFGTWYGIKVENGDIVEINMANNKLTGPLPAVISNLQKLRLLMIYNNTAMGGTIPTSLATIQTLQDLNLANCGLTGAIPSALFDLSALKTLDLQSNALTGGIPANVGNATSLTILSLTANRTLGGPIPVSICSLINLKTLSLEVCALTGAIPNDIGNLSSLEVLELHRNPLSGGIPTSIGMLKKLTLLNLSENGLTGSIPAGISELIDLESLRMNSNQLSGEIPEQIGYLTKLTELLLNNNALTGSIPTSVVKLVKLQALGLNSNKLTGRLPVDMGNMVELLALNLELNQLSGEIPASLGNLKLLATLRLGNNKLSGEIPATFSDLRQLTVLYLYENQFSGPLPALEGLSKLKALYVYKNFFTGGIPASYSGLTELTELYLHNNQLSGELPASFGTNWAKLIDLNLSDNDFTGAFPPSIGSCTNLSAFRAANNKFTSIPQALLNSLKLAVITCYNNRLVSIPNFTGYANNARLTLSTQLNYLGYDMLEPLLNADGTSMIKTLTYRPQKAFDQVRRIDVPLGNTLELRAASKGTAGSIVWEKKNADGTWANLNAGNADNSQQTYRLPNVTAAAVGTYRWTATNTKLTSATLQSIEIDVRVVEAVKQTGDRGIALYNGLISAARWRTTKARGATGGDLTGMYVYQYDDKYQIKDASWAEANNTLNTYTWGGNRFRLTGLEYDANGNIQKLNRYNDQAQQQHKFQYHYKNNTNQLTSVDGYAQAYDYDEIGRTTKVDKTEGEDQYVDYDVTGKVVTVYSTIEKRPQDKKVEYLYDDRGFRMAKVNYALNRTTWYIRDASGNILNVYDQEGTQESTNNNPVTKTEMPVYAGGKVGTYYPAQDGSMEYELTDHLGNVRALVREDVKTYTATMEDSEEENIHNPRIEEIQYFQNIWETVTEPGDVHMNHTAATREVPNPSRSAYLYWNDTPGTLASQKSTGPAIALQVQPGDTIRAEAFARYEEKESYSHAGITLSVLSAMLGNTFAFAPGIDGATPTQVSAWFNGALSAPNFLNYTDETVRPNAYLSYIVFDENMVLINGYSHREPVSVEAGFGPGEEAAGAHERVYLRHPVIIPAGGKYIYVWVSNESPETRVWFDDFSVTHTTSYVSQSTDYGAWGDVLRTTSTDPAPPAALRRNLKGQYAFSGNAQDQSGNGLNGTVSGAVLTTGVDGEANKAYSFNGVNSYVKLEGSADELSFVQNTGVFTIAAYIKLNDLNARSAIVSSITSTNQKGFAFVFDTNGGDYGTHALRFSSTRGDGSSLNLGTGTDYAINDTEWHHVAVVGDGSTFRFYIDGEPDGYGTAFNSFSLGTSVGDILIGASRTTATNIQLPMNGSIDEVHIFDKALSGSEIRLLADGASPEQIDQVLQPVNRGYRYQYQGQFAEKDEETGWNHFELREYDPVIGRWTATDPKGQFFSPYVGMGNNPVNGVDPDGALFGKIRAQIAAFLHNGEYGIDDYGDWFATWGDVDYGGQNSDINAFSTVTKNYGSSGLGIRKFVKEATLSDVWNSAGMRTVIPDYIVVSGSYQGAFGGYLGNEVSFTLMLRGQDAGLFFNDAPGYGVTLSGGADAGGSIGTGYFITADPRLISSSILEGPQVTLAVGAEAKYVVGGGFGGAVDASYDETGVTSITTKIYGTVGVGFASPVHVSVGGAQASPARPIFKF